jgi:hypothetical protein
MIDIKRLFVLPLAFVLSGMALAQVPGDLLWETAVGGSDDEWLADVVQTHDGGYATVGWTCTYGTTLDISSLWLVKVDRDGSNQWHKTYGGAQSDEGNSLALTRDGGFIIAGSTYSLATTLKDAWILRTDGEGNTLWTVLHDGGSYDCAYAVIQNRDGDFVAAGYSTDALGFSRVLLMKIGPAGNTIWTKTYGGSGNDEANGLVQTADGGYVVCGYTTSMGAGAQDVLLLKTDSNGNELWSRSFGTPLDDRGRAVKEVPGGDLVLCGGSGPMSGDRDFWMARTSADGNTVWETTLPGTGVWDQANDVVVAPDGGFVFAGLIGFGANKDEWIIKTDGSGTIEWEGLYGGTDYIGEVAAGVCIDRAGDIVTVGQKSGTGILETDGWILKIHSGLTPTASCTPYCGSGVNLDTYTIAAPFVIGGTFQGTVGFPAPNVGAVIAGYLGCAVFPIWGQEALLDIGTPEVMGLPSGIGISPVSITWGVPNDPAYAGYDVYTQAAGFGGGAINLTCAFACGVGI